MNLNWSGKSFLIVLLLSLFNAPIKAQFLNNYIGDETMLYAETKQVNQFFRRFNNEEDVKGVRYDPDQPEFRNLNDRIKYLNILFDIETSSIQDTIKSGFIQSVNDPSNPQFLNFHGKDWFAEVSTVFTYNGVQQPLTLFLVLEPDRLGYKWAIKNVYFKPFYDLFVIDTSFNRRFLHPLSHELDFMNLIKVFSENDKVIDYTTNNYRPDYLTIFLYELKKGTLKFNTIQKVKFHFFQIPGWYFELTEFNRPGNNRGWLISNLLRIEPNQKDKIVDVIIQHN